MSTKTKQRINLETNDKIMKQEIVVRMWAAAPCVKDRLEFLSEYALSPCWGDNDMVEDDELCERAKACGHIWDVAHMSITEIREAAGLSRAMLSKRLAIPQSTIQSWESGEECPGHVRFMAALLVGILDKHDYISISADMQEIVVEMWADAPCVKDRGEFLSEWALSSCWGDNDMAEGDELCERAKACGHIWDVAHMSIKEIREAAGMSQAMLSKRLAIPQSTIQSWEAGEECPDYVRFMVALLTGVITTSN